MNHKKLQEKWKKVKIMGQAIKPYSASLVPIAIGARLYYMFSLRFYLSKYMFFLFKISVHLLNQRHQRSILP